MVTISLLADIIMPEDEESVSATEAGVPEFIEFIVKDIPEHQIPMRGGLMWINRESNKRFETPFNEIPKENQMEIIDSMAYPRAFEENSPGPVFLGISEIWWLLGTLPVNLVLSILIIVGIPQMFGTVYQPTFLKNTEWNTTKIY